MANAATRILQARSIRPGTPPTPELGQGAGGGGCWVHFHVLTLTCFLGGAFLHVLNYIDCILGYKRHTAMHTPPIESHEEKEHQTAFASSWVRVKARIYYISMQSRQN